MSALVRPLLLDAGSDAPIPVEKLCSIEADVEEEEDEVDDPKISKSYLQACLERVGTLQPKPATRTEEQKLLRPHAEVNAPTGQDSARRRKNDQEWR